MGALTKVACASDAHALLEDLLTTPAGSPARPSPRAAWERPVRLVPLARGRRARQRTAKLRRPAAVAATALLAGGLLAASTGGARVLAAPSTRAAVAPAAAPAAVTARGALAGVRVASAASTADRALLSELLAAPVASGAVYSAPAAVPAFELAAETVAAPAAVSFATVTQLPRSAFAYQQAAVSLPEITLAQQVLPPPAPPVAVRAAQQPPAPPGYQQPPGYQDGVPFGGQPGAVPRPQTPGRPAAGGGATVRPAVPATYVVRAGDTLSSIALRFYGSARFAATIWDVNYRLIGGNPNAIYPGQRLTLPGISVRPAPTTPLPARGPIGQRTNYTIQPRDFLRWIAQRAYGTEVFWPEIYHANRNVLGPNPDLIYPGVTVYIP